MNSKDMRRRDWCRTVLGAGAAALVPSSARAQQGAATTTHDQRLADAIKRGATMEELAALRPAPPATPQEGIHALKTGNARFFGGVGHRGGLSAVERHAMLMGQSPFAVILSCSDSRVPTEIVFDQGPGDLFITRVAGNVVERGTLGSIEYAVGHLKTSVVVVMGHEGCGAVKAALLSPEERSHETENIRFLLDGILPSVKNLPRIRDDKARIREAGIANVRQQVQKLLQVKFLKDAVTARRVAIIGAFYEISSGAVDFLETEEELRVTATSFASAAWRAHLA